MRNQQIDQAANAAVATFRIGWYENHPNDKILNSINDVVTRSIFNALRVNNYSKP